MLILEISKLSSWPLKEILLKKIFPKRDLVLICLGTTEHEGLVNAEETYLLIENY